MCSTNSLVDDDRDAFRLRVREHPKIPLVAERQHRQLSDLD